MFKTKRIAVFKKGELNLNINIADHKLFIIEGLMGSGKSTFTAKFHEKLLQNNIDSFAINELQIRNTIFFAWDNSISTKKAISETIKSWKVMKKNILNSNQTAVLDAIFFQRTAKYMISRNIPAADISKTFNIIFRKIKSLNPCLIYFREHDIEASLKRVFKSRGGPFSKFHQNWIDGINYSKQNRISGFEATVSFWQTYLEFVEENLSIFQNKIIIDDPRKNREKHFQDIYKIFKLT